MEDEKTQKIHITVTDMAQKKAEQEKKDPSKKAQKPSAQNKRKKKKEKQPKPTKEEKKAKVKEIVPFIDYEFLLAVVFLMSFGLIMLYSASAYTAQVEFDDNMHFFIRQLLFCCISFVGMFIVAMIDYHWFGVFSGWIMGISVILMLLVKTPLGVSSMGAQRWLPLPFGFNFQPAELAKLAIIIYAAYFICRYSKSVNTPGFFFRMILLGVVTGGIVYIFTENLSTAVIVMCIPVAMLFVAHPKIKPFVILVGIGVSFAALVVGVVVISAEKFDSFRMERILTWIDQEKYASEGGFQVLQGLYAIGSGGFWGKGLGNSTQKLGVIPEVQNDMILPIICEELGVFGVIVILILFGYLLYRLMFIARNAPDLFGSLIAVGIFTHVALQVILNIAVVTNMLPTTGITLPFFSYGGTSVLFLMAEMGMALGVSRKIVLD